MSKPYCSICGVPYEGFGNNAWPVNPGRCCDVCNNLVIMRRIRNVREGRPAYGYPDWWNPNWKEEVAEPSAPQVLPTEAT